jgi:hypothetical protein
MLIRLVSFLLIELHLNYLDIHYNDESNAMSTDLTTIEQTTGESKLRSVQLHERTDDRSPDYYDRVLAIAYRNNIERMLDPRVSKSASKLAPQIFSILLAATRLLTIGELQHTICAIQDPIDSSIYSAPLRWSAIQQTCRGMIVKDSAEFVTFLNDSLATFVDRDPKLAEIQRQARGHVSSMLPVSGVDRILTGSVQYCFGSPGAFEEVASSDICWTQLENALRQQASRNPMYRPVQLCGHLSGPR